MYIRFYNDTDEIMMRPIRYEFDKCDNEWDANWVCFEFMKITGNMEYSKEDASLLTWEISALRDLMEGQEDFQTSFMEPNVSFIRVGTTLELRLAYIFPKRESYYLNLDENNSSLAYSTIHSWAEAFVPR